MTSSPRPGPSAHLYAQHSLGAKNVASLLSQQVTHEHIEAILIQGATSSDAHRAHICEIMDPTALALGLLHALLQSKVGEGELPSSDEVMQQFSAQGKAGSAQKLFHLGLDD